MDQYACLVLLFLVPAKLNAKPPDFSEPERLVPEELKQRNTPGAVIAIVSGDRVVYQKAFGVANIETGAPMQPEMLFRLGSTTKMFTAAALVSLAEQNKINLNEPVGNGIKGLNPGIHRFLLARTANLGRFNQRWKAVRQSRRQ